VVQLEIKPLELAVWTVNYNFTLASLLDIEALYQNSVFSRRIRNRIKKLFNAFQSFRHHGASFASMILFNLIFIQGADFIRVLIFLLDGKEKTKMLQCSLELCCYV
jgi:hypothetical protein